MLKIPLLLLLGAGCLLSPAAYAQNKTLQGGAPDASLLPAGGGNASGNVYAPDLFNGTVNISVPIYSYGQNDISLHYNTGGIRVNEPSGNIGNHWDLAAGGSISRQPKDLPDEINVPVDSVSNIMGGGAVSAPAADGLRGKWTQYGLGHIGLSGNNIYLDEESDDFFFSVGNLSFAFNIGQNGAVFTRPQTNIKIELWMNGQQVTAANPLPSDGATGMLNLTFRVRDDQGNWYYFQKGDVSRMAYGDRSDPDLEYAYISRWVIQKIIRNDGQETTFQYNVRDNHSNMNVEYMSYSAFEQDNLSFQPCPAIATGGVEVLSYHNLNSFSNLASIKYPNNVTASFIYVTPTVGRCDEPGDVIMNEIRIQSGIDGVRYIFDQAYSLAKKNSSDTHPAEIPIGPCRSIDQVPFQYDHNYWYHRLILKGVRIVSMDSSRSEPYYSFFYNNAVRLPSKLSGAQDYFGYYNGKLVNDAYGGRFNIPLHTTKFSAPVSYGVDKTPDIAYAVAGLLQSVENGKGGITNFEYETHQLSNVTSAAGITLPTDNWFFGANANDGVRIKRITTSEMHYSSQSQFRKQTFTYEGGQRFMPGGYFDYPVYTVIQGTPVSSVNLKPNTIFSGTFVSPHQFVNGSNHGYSRVIVIESNATDQQLSKKDMTFQNISTAGHTSYYRTGNKQYFEMPYTDKQYIKDWELGLPLTITEYDAYNNILSRATNVYDFSRPMIQPVTGTLSNLKRLSTSEGGNLSTYASETYVPYTSYAPLIQTTIEKYLDDYTTQTDVVSYDYDDHRNLAATNTRNSKGENFSLKKIYNYNVAGPGVPYGNLPGTLYNMTSDGLEVCVGMEHWKNGTSGPSSNTLIDGSITRFRYLQNVNLLSQKLLSLQTLNPITYPAYTGLGTGVQGNPYSRILNAYDLTYTQPIPDYQVASEVLQFDVKGNPLETQLKGQNSFVAVMWDPINGNKVADVQNAHQADIAFTSFERLDGVGYTGTETSTSGGFTYNQLGSEENGMHMSGVRSFRLVPSGSTQNNYINSPALTTDKKYIITFWCNGTPPGIKDIAGQAITPVMEYALSNGWKFYKAQFTPTQNGIIRFTAQGTATYLDELRLFPAGAVMKNWVYAPYIGATSSTDATGRITYYLYDVMGRQVAGKDQEGNVTSKTEFRIAQ